MEDQTNLVEVFESPRDRWLRAMLVTVICLIGGGWEAWQSITPSVAGRPLDQVVLAESPSMQLDLNQADVNLLCLLPGVGPALSQRIVEHRAKHGPFESLEDLDEVPGIGPETLRYVEPMVWLPKPQNNVEISAVAGLPRASGLTLSP